MYTLYNKYIFNVIVECENVTIVAKMPKIHTFRIHCVRISTLISLLSSAQMESKNIFAVVLHFLFEIEQKVTSEWEFFFFLLFSFSHVTCGERRDR